MDLSLDFEQYLTLLVDADRESPLPLRVHLMIPAPSALAARVTAEPSRDRQLTPRIGVTHVKLFAGRRPREPGSVALARLRR